MWGLKRLFVRAFVRAPHVEVLFFGRRRRVIIDSSVARWSNEWPKGGAKQSVFNLLDIGQANTKIQSSSPDEEVEEFKKSRIF